MKRAKAIKVYAGTCRHPQDIPVTSDRKTPDEGNVKPQRRGVKAAVLVVAAMLSGWLAALARATGQEG